MSLPAEPRGGTRRRSGVRLRLTALYGVLFLASGAGLLGITYWLASNATDNVIVTSAGHAREVFLANPRNGTSVSYAADSAGPVPSPEQLQQQARQYRLQALSERSDERRELLLTSGLALAIMGVASVALGWFAAGRALRPLRRITMAARRISASNLQERLAVAGPADDLRELADTIDGLFGRLEASFDAQRQFIANASHELRTPLTRSRTLVEVALRDPAATAESLGAACERVLVANQQQEQLIEALLTLARSQNGPGARRPFDLATITHDLLAARGGDAASRGVTMEVTLAPAPMAGDVPLAERAVANLLDNALRHNVEGGTVWVTSETVSGWAVLRVANTGPDVSPGDIPRLLRPFQRRGTSCITDAFRADGLGLGLPIVQAIATAHDAALTLAPRAGGGLTAELSFPAPQPDGYRSTQVASQ